LNSLCPKRRNQAIAPEHTSPIVFLCALPIRPHIRATPAAGLASESRFEIRQPYVIRPFITVDGCPMAAPKVRAIDHQAAHARGAHFGEGDFLKAESFEHVK
jgi:hypothetical protein